jgi:hypothetical protein
LLLLLLLQVSAALKRRLAERKDDTEQAVLLLRKLGEADDTLQVRHGGRATATALVMAANSFAPGCAGQLVPVEGANTSGSCVHNSNCAHHGSCVHVKALAGTARVHGGRCCA